MKIELVKGYSIKRKSEKLHKARLGKEKHMKIEEELKGVLKTFNAIEVGDCFTLNGNYYIKTDEGDAINLSSGRHFAVSYDRAVCPVNAKVVVE